MASFTCHVVCVTKRVRLERFVRPPHAALAHDIATTRPLSQTIQQVWPSGLRLALAGAKAKIIDSRGEELSLRAVRSRLVRSNLAKSRACPKPNCCKTDCRRLHCACEMQTLRISEVLQITWNPATTVRETRPNTRVKPCREAASA